MKTAWKKQQAAMLDAISEQHGKAAKRAFLALRSALFVELANEQRTKRQVQRHCAGGAVHCRHDQEKVQAVPGMRGAEPAMREMPGT